MEKQPTTKVPDEVRRWFDYMFDLLFNNTGKNVNEMEKDSGSYGKEHNDADGNKLG